jgi:xanthine dehydrogenase YagS FAD-binding subunit
LRPFAYARPTDAEEATTLLLESPDAQFIAGGTNITDLMKLGVTRTARLVDLSAVLPRGIDELDGGGLRIGAGVTNAALAAHPVVRRDYPVLSQAVLAGASGQIRNVATVGGNLLQRTRCVYFQDITRPCNKRTPGDGCSAIAGGGGRDFAVLGASEHCIATYPGDMAVALSVLDASVRVRRASGDVELIPVSGLYRLPEDHPQKDTVLASGDLILGLELPPPRPSLARYRKVRDRASYAFALVSVAAYLAVDGDEPAGLRLAFGGLAPRPWRARIAEAALLGVPLTPAAVADALRSEFAHARPLGGNAYKIDMASSVASAVSGDLLRRLEEQT